MTDKLKSLLFDERFLWFLGAFHGAWSSLELVTSYGIKKFLNISDEQAHILTSGMEFGRKAILLRNLAYRSEDPKRKTIIQLVAKLQNESKRNVFAHAFMISNESAVTFIDRTRGGDYEATKHVFTLKEFADHVTSVTATAKELHAALDLNDEILHRFAMAALSANTKSAKSPTPPISSA
ncbi:MAG TPA: hypothetical protein VKT73_01770 [Xanthobacteraceae bacterium]|nr:hypothetical protein [Xanthobacteraceae bacterium]